MTEENEAGFLGLEDLEEAAARKVVAPAWAYLQGGAVSERALRANREAFLRRTVRPRALRGVSRLDLSSQLLGSKVAAPFFVAPTAYQGLLHPEAEEGMARAASAAGVLAVFSTMSSVSLEEIAAAAPKGPRWFQLYLQPKLAQSQELVERAEAAGFSALVLTVDLPVLGTRPRQAQGGVAMDTAIPLGNGPHIQSPPRRPVAEGDHFTLNSDLAAATWEVVGRLRSMTKMPIVVKGILTAEDAQLAVEHGAKGVVVSNHGGRQLDLAPASLDALPEVVAAVGSKAEVYVDGGVRHGQDVLLALAMGAKGVGLGRLPLWGLAAGGQAGVAHVLALMKEELATTMALTGCRNVGEISPSLLGPPRP